MDPTRRQILKAGAAIGGGLFIGFHLSPLHRAAHTAEAAPAAADGGTPASFAPNAYLRIDPDDTVTVAVGKSEMGQGVLTSLPMIVAEELDADWSKVRVEQAGADVAFVMPGLAVQLTGGSTSVRLSWQPLRQAGATAREMLISAAADTWKVDRTECRADTGAVIHKPSGRRATYGSLVAKAVTVPRPVEVPLRNPKTFRLIGKSLARLDTPSKVAGSAVYGIDVKVPGLLTAVVARCPVLGGKVARFDGSRAEEVGGVRHVVRIEAGVAVVADNFWAAKKGRDLLHIDWTPGANADVHSSTLRDDYAAKAESPGIPAAARGDSVGALKRAAKVVESVYETPFQAHAPMEPLNCVAHVRPDGCDVWVGTQAQSWVEQTATTITGLPASAVTVHTTLLGGGFGRRAETDFVAEAVELSKAVQAPVKVVWTREDDTRHGFYRPGTYNKLTAAIGTEGELTVWTHRIVGQSVAERSASFMIRDGIDPTAVEGAADLAYDVESLRVEWVRTNPGVPAGFWRSVGHSNTAFVTECFLDEVAEATGADPLDLRLRLLESRPRHRAVVELAAAKAGWGSPLPPGHGRGIATHECFATWVAQVAEVSVGRDGDVEVHRIVCAIDCGTVVNPDTVRAQVESSVAFGLTAALKGEITFSGGRVQQGNFHDYPILRMSEMPAVEVHIVSSLEPPGGVGEPGVPPVAPAVANAVFAATGRRLRSLPLRPADLRSI